MMNAQIPFFNMLSIPINSFTNHKKGIRAPKPLRFCLVRTYDKFEKKMVNP